MAYALPPSWQLTLKDRPDHQRRRQRQVYTMTTVRTDCPGSEVYRDTGMGKQLELTNEKLRAYPVGTSRFTGTSVMGEPDDGRNIFKLEALVAGLLRTANLS